MTSVRAKLSRWLVSTTINDWPRILAARYRGQPTGAGFGSSRFSSPSRRFKVLYAASDFGTAFAEAIARDRFVKDAGRSISREELDDHCLTTIRSTRVLTLLDLRRSAAYEAGIDTDITSARDHDPGQRLSAAVYAEMPEVEGILYESQLTKRDCVALYDRAFAALTATNPIDLLQATGLEPELRRLGIKIDPQRRAD